MATKKPFTEPQIIRSKSTRSTHGDWYIEYFYEYPDRPGEYKVFKIRDGMNYIHDLALREVEAQSLLKEITRRLESGEWNPFNPDKIVNTILEETEENVEIIKAYKSGWTVVTAISEFENFIEGEGYSKTTVHAYKKYLNAFKDWSSKNNQSGTIMANFTEMAVQKFLNQLFKDNDWAPRTYNNYLKFMVTFFQASQRLERTRSEDRAIRYNFDPQGLKTKKVVAQRNKAYTPVQIANIKKAIDRLIKAEPASSAYKNLKDYIRWISLSLMRPDEIRHLKVANIDEQSRQIRILGKTGDRIVPISNQLMQLISERGVFTSGANSFVFGYMGGIDQRRMSVAYFLDLYAPVKVKLNLDVNHGLYSFKPTAIINLIKAGFKDEEIMLLSGHKTVEAFRVYKRDLVLENADVMKGDAIDF